MKWNILFDKYYISNHKIMDNISKTKNERCEFNYCSISDINSFLRKIYNFKSLINLWKNATIKHCSIIFQIHIKNTHNIV